jgi:hypothetical protein
VCTHADKGKKIYGKTTYEMERAVCGFSERIRMATHLVKRAVYKENRAIKYESKFAYRYFELFC